MTYRSKWWGIAISFLMSFSVYGQKVQKLSGKIARYYGVNRSEIEVLEVEKIRIKKSRSTMIRQLNSQIGFPSGYGQVFQIPKTYHEVFYVCYRYKGNRFIIAYDKHYRRLWTRPETL